jgi:hypothetical protein
MQGDAREHVGVQFFDYRAPVRLTASARWSRTSAYPAARSSAAAGKASPGLAHPAHAASSVTSSVPLTGAVIAP